VGAFTECGVGALPSSTRAGDEALFSSSAALLEGGVPAVSSPLVGVLALASSWGRVLVAHLCRSHNGGLLYGLLWGSSLCDIMIGSRRLSCLRARNIARINIRGSSTRTTQFKVTTPILNSTIKETFLARLTD